MLSLLGLQRLLRRRLLASADVDLPRLHRLGDLAHQLDREQAVLQVRAAHLDMVGKRETPLERAGRNPAVNVIVAAVLALFGLLAADDQHVLLGGDVDLVALETGDGQLDPIIIVAELDQVERG